MIDIKLLRDDPEPPTAPTGGLRELLAAQAGVARVRATDALLQYVVAVLRGTREHPLSEAGASPRSGQQLLAAARARAALLGRDFVLPDDVQQDVQRAQVRAQVTVRVGDDRRPPAQHRVPGE